MHNEICIGEQFNLETQMFEAKKTIIINDAQREIILRFAEKRIDKEGSEIYKLNGCEFTIGLHWGDRKFYKERQILSQRLANKAANRRYEKEKKELEKLQPNETIN